MPQLPVSMTGAPPPIRCTQVSCAVPALAAMCGHEDEEVASEACWALAAVSGGSSERAQVCCAAAFPSFLSPVAHLRVPLLETAHDVAAAAPLTLVPCTLTLVPQVVAGSGCVGTMVKLLAAPSPSVRQRRASWAL